MTVVDGGDKKSDRTRQRILDSAAKVLRQQGYTARLADIAAAAEMQAGSLYYYFEGRETLVSEVLRIGVEEALRHVTEAVDAAPADATPLTRLELAIRAATTAVLELGDYPAANSRVYPTAPEAVRAEHYPLQKAYGDYMHGLLQAAVASGELRSDLDLQVVRMLMFGAINWTAEWFRPGRGRSAPDVVDQVVAMCLDGLRGER